MASSSERALPRRSGRFRNGADSCRSGRLNRCPLCSPSSSCMRHICRLNTFRSNNPSSSCTSHICRLNSCPCLCSPSSSCTNRICRLSKRPSCSRSSSYTRRTCHPSTCRSLCNLSSSCTSRICHWNNCQTQRNPSSNCTPLPRRLSLRQGTCASPEQEGARTRRRHQEQQKFVSWRRR